MVSVKSAHTGKLIVVSDNHPAFASCNMLNRMEAEHGHIGQGAQTLSTKGRTYRVASIINKRQTMPFRNVPQRIPIAWLPCIIHRDNRFCPGGDLIFNADRVNQQGVRRYVSENGRGTCITYTVGGGGKRYRGHNNFIALPDPKAQDGNMKRSCSTRNSNAMLCPTIFSHIIFKPGDGRACGQIFTLKDTLHSLKVFLVDELTSIRNHYSIAFSLKFRISSISRK